MGRGHFNYAGTKLAGLDKKVPRAIGPIGVDGIRGLKFE